MKDINKRANNLLIVVVLVLATAKLWDLTPDTDLYTMLVVIFAIVGTHRLLK